MVPVPKFLYSDEQMQDAIKDVSRGMAVSAAAKLHHVPRTTLQDKVKGNTPSVRRMGPSSILTKEEEDSLVVWISAVSKAGFPVTQTDLLNSVQLLVKKLGRPNTFKDGRPGKKWFELFKKRNPSITTRVSENLTISRANVTKESLNKWFADVRKYLDDQGHSSILSNPKRVFNCDETAFFLNPKGNKVLTLKGEKNVYQIVNSDEKENLTVLITANADGKFVHPLILFKYDRIPQDIAFSVPENWGVGKSQSGWMTGELFFNFMSNIFYPWIITEGIELPVILFIDGHCSHLTLETSEFCDSHGIVLVALHPNATHLIQPMDVSVFRALKVYWKNKVHEWRINNAERPCLKKRDFAPLLKQALSEVSSETVRNGFRKCGIYPWNPNAVSLHTDRRSDNELTRKLKEMESAENKVGLKVLERNIPPEKLASFQMHENWTGDVQDESLFEVWKKIAMKVTSDRVDGGNHMDGSSLIDNGIHENEVDGMNERSLILNEINENEEVQMNESSLILNEIDENENDLPTNRDVSCETEAASSSMANDNAQPENDEIEQSNVKNAIPSPFKNSLFWPPASIQTTARSRKNKEGRPGSVVTSKEWQSFYTEKAKKKREAEEAKLKRAEERLRKRKEKEELNRKKKEEAATRKKKEATMKISSKVRNNKKNGMKNKDLSSSEDDEEWAPSQSSHDSESDMVSPLINPHEGNDVEPGPSTSYVSLEEDIAQMEAEPTFEVTELTEMTMNQSSMTLEKTPVDSDDNLANVFMTSTVEPSTSHTFDQQMKGANLIPTAHDIIINMGDYISARRCTRNKSFTMACQVIDLVDDEHAMVIPLNPCNRLRNVFVKNEKDILTIELNTIIKKLPQPITYGNAPGSKRLQFPTSLDVDW